MDKINTQTHFRCYECGEVFKKEWTDEEAINERKENWGDISEDECEVLCDDCYNKLMTGFN